MTRSLIVAGVGLAVIIAAIVLHLTQSREDAASIAPGQQVEQPRTGDKQAEGAVKPSFDVVRINREGNTVIAGRAMPKAEVVILDGGKEIGRVIADTHGEWVFVPDLPLPAGARTLSLKAANPDGTTAETAEPVVLVVPDKPVEGELPLALKSTAQGTVVLQGPGGEDGPVSIAVVDHDGAGRAVLAGKAAEGATVMLYVDEKFAGKTVADKDGKWRIALKDAIGPGDHLLRADQVDAKGAVIARAEVEFTPNAPGLVTDGKIVVEKGQSLWRIATKLYGKGPAYTVIYKANKQQIRNPDLIYPGQVFVVPAR